MEEMELQGCGEIEGGWKSDLFADLWSQVVMFLDPAEHAELRCVSVELRDTIAYHYVNALLLVAEGAGPDGTRFPLAGPIPYEGAALIDLPIDPPCGVPSWGAYFALVGGRDALLDEMWRRPLLERAVVLVHREPHRSPNILQVLKQTNAFKFSSLPLWQRVAMAYCVGDRDLFNVPKQIECEALFQILCGDAYGPVTVRQCSSAPCITSPKHIVFVDEDELTDVSSVREDLIAVLGFLPSASPRALQHYLHHLVFTEDVWQGDECSPPGTEGHSSYHNATRSCWLADSLSLQTVEFRSARALSEFGEGFLRGCTNLSHVSLAGLPKLKSINRGFAMGCDHLVSAKFHVLPSLEEIGHAFLAGCMKLTRVSFESLPALTSISTHFLSSDANLNSLSFPELPMLKSIGKSFMAYCTNLAEISFVSLPVLTRIDGKFLEDCKSLQSLQLPVLPLLEAFHEQFLAELPMLATVSFAGLPALKSISRGFISKCPLLRSVTLPVLSSLEEISCGFLEGCEALADISFAGGLPKLRTLEDSFLRGCTELRLLKFPAMPMLEKIGNSFLTRCANLTEIHFREELPMLRAIGHGFLHQCPQLLHVNFSQLEHVTSVGEPAFDGCSAALLPSAQQWIASRRAPQKQSNRGTRRGKHR